jgi:DNA mismatch repair protein MutS2
LPEKANTGDSVFIVSLEKIGKIESIDNVNSSVSVLLGNSIKAKYGFDDVLTPLTIAKKNKPQKTIIEKKYPTDIHEEKPDNEIPHTLQMHYNTCDLRGLKVEEALNKLESDLDKMIRNAINTAVIIHGHGTGALKEAVRNKLKTSSYVKKFRPGEYGEGGDGVTIASLTN